MQLTGPNPIMNELTQKELDEVFARLGAQAEDNIRESKVKPMDPVLNLSHPDFFEQYVKNVNWKPLQNHGLEQLHNKFNLETNDQDWPGQINSYLDLLVDINLDGAKILDVGCGWGRGVDVLRRYYNIKVHGIDNNKEFIEYARTNYPNNHYFTSGNTELKDYNILLFMDSMHVMFEPKLFHSIAPDTLLVVSDFFTPDTYEQFKNMIEVEKFTCLLEKDNTEAVMKAMTRDLDTLKTRFNSIEPHIVSTFKHVQLNRLHQFEIGHSKQYKFVIQT
jgi:2-polyprenyl-3-methyl-5-hydroxy-6-metoxy-1,4-benzoquinol methylase